MKITKETLLRIIKEEIKIIEAEEGEKIMAAISDIPQAAAKIADSVKKEIESLSDPSGLDPKVLAQAVAAILTSD